LFKTLVFILLLQIFGARLAWSLNYPTYQPGRQCIEKNPLRLTDEFKKIKESILIHQQCKVNLSICSKLIEAQHFTKISTGQEAIQHAVKQSELKQEVLSQESDTLSNAFNRILASTALNPDKVSSDEARLVDAVALEKAMQDAEGVKAVLADELVGSLAENSGEELGNAVYGEVLRFVEKIIPPGEIRQYLGNQLTRRVGKEFNIGKASYSNDRLLIGLGEIMAERLTNSFAESRFSKKQQKNMKRTLYKMNLGRQVGTKVTSSDLNASRKKLSRSIKRESLKNANLVTGKVMTRSLAILGGINGIAVEAAITGALNTYKRKKGGKVKTPSYSRCEDKSFRQQTYTESNYQISSNYFAISKVIDGNDNTLRKCGPEPLFSPATASFFSQYASDNELAQYFLDNHLHPVTGKPLEKLPPGPNLGRNHLCDHLFDIVETQSSILDSGLKFQCAVGEPDAVEFFFSEPKGNNPNYYHQSLGGYLKVKFDQPLKNSTDAAAALPIYGSFIDTNSGVNRFPQKAKRQGLELTGFEFNHNGRQHNPSIVGGICNRLPSFPCASKKIFLSKANSSQRAMGYRRVCGGNPVQDPKYCYGKDELTGEYLISELNENPKFAKKDKALEQSLLAQMAVPLLGRPIAIAKNCCATDGSNASNSLCKKYRLNSSKKLDVDRRARPTDR